MCVKLSRILFLFTVFSLSPAFATTQIIAFTSPNMSIDYDIGPKGHSVKIINFLFWPLKGECKIFAKKKRADDQVTLLAKGETGEVIINGIKLKKGDKKITQIQLNQYIPMSATVGASILLTNQSDYDLKATCQAV